MKSLVTISIVILFFAVSTFGNFIVGYCLPMECLPMIEPEDCATIDCGTIESETCPGEEIMDEMAGCGESPKTIPIRKCRSRRPPRPVPVKARCVLPIVLAFAPATIPSCARVCTVHSLSDFREGPNSDIPSPDLIPSGHQDFAAACLDHEIPPYTSRPIGVHYTISTTVLRL